MPKLPLASENERHTLAPRQNFSSVFIGERKAEPKLQEGKEVPDKGWWELHGPWDTLCAWPFVPCRSLLTTPCAKHQLSALSVLFLFKVIKKVYGRSPARRQVSEGYMINFKKVLSCFYL